MWRVGSKMFALCAHVWVWKAKIELDKEKVFNAIDVVSSEAIRLKTNQLSGDISH